MRLLGLVVLCLALALPAKAEPRGTIVAFGDSITNGRPFPWPEVLERRLRRQFPATDVAVSNAGLAGNQLLQGIGNNPSGLSRFAQDALGVPGVRIIILLEGINDIGAVGLAKTEAGKNDPRQDGARGTTAAAIIAGYRTLIAAAHAKHIRIYGGTLLPFIGVIIPGYYSEEGEAIRKEVNQWIRTAGAFDGVIDFDKALRDPANPLRLRPEFDSGDHLHPSVAGEAAMADAIDLSILQ